MRTLPKCFGIIPARYGSSRFPGKPLAEIQGKPMFWHVYSQACKCPEMTRVVVATDDNRILTAAENLNVPALMTQKDHPSGTDRILEAARALNLPGNAVIVNIQGDEPLLDPAILTEILLPFIEDDIQVTTPVREISPFEAKNPDLVKAVFSESRRALYFSRSIIPFDRNNQTNRYYGHIGLYAFRMNVLKKFVELSPSSLETTEKLEQLRLLENDIPINIILTSYTSISVDRPEDINRVEKILSENN